MPAKPLNRAARSATRSRRCAGCIRPARSSRLIPCRALQNTSVAVPSPPRTAAIASNPARSSVSLSSCAKRASRGSWNIASYSAGCARAKSRYARATAATAGAPVLRPTAARIAAASSANPASATVRMISVFPPGKCP